MGHPEYVCRCNQRRDWCVFFCLCPVILQKKAQAQQTREFHKKSIKEKAVHLSGLFTGGGPAELQVTAGFVMAPPAPPRPLPSSMLVSMLTHTMWHAAFLLSCLLLSASSLTASSVFFHHRLQTLSSYIWAGWCMVQHSQPSFDWSKT